MSAEFTVLQPGPLSAIKKKQRKVRQETGERISALPQKRREIILKSQIQRSPDRTPRKKNNRAETAVAHPSPQSANIR